MALLKKVRADGIERFRRCASVCGFWVQNGLVISTFAASANLCPLGERVWSIYPEIECSPCPGKGHEGLQRTTMVRRGGITSQILGEAVALLLANKGGMTMGENKKVLDKPLKIVQAIDAGGWGGAEKVLVMLANGLTKAGHDVEVWVRKILFYAKNRRLK